jgi:prevent-host-death family protein
MSGIQARTVKRRIGKAQAREEFSPLVEAVARGAGAVEITDYGKVVAVLLSEKEYQWLSLCAQRNGTPKRELCGSLVFDDDLEKLGDEVAADFDRSLEKTAGLL